MKTADSRLWAYSAAHFWVDFSCALLMFSRMRSWAAWGELALIYNFCAFALQMPIGLLADRRSRNSLVAAVGCALVGLGWLFVPSGSAAVILAGVGNACFHVGGGIHVLNRSEKRGAALGIFVSPGALGIYFGTLLGKTERITPLVPLAGLVLFGLLIPRLDIRKEGTLVSGNAPAELALSRWSCLALTCLVLVVALRSYLGMVLRFPWKTGGWALAAICAVAGGKAAGGFAGDALGLQRGAALSLGGAALCFLLSGSPVAGVLAMFLFNMTMPMTLWEAARLLPGGKGFSFGLLTFALFLGFVPAYLGLELPSAGGWYSFGAILSLMLLLLGLKLGGKHEI